MDRERTQRWCAEREGRLGDGRGKTAAAKPPGARQDEETAPRPSDGGNQPGQGFSLKQKAGTKAGPAGQAGEDRLQPDPSPKKLRSLPQKKFFPAPRPETFGKPFFWRCGAALPPRAVPKNATRSAGVSLPCRAEGARSSRRCFLHRPIPKAQRSSRPRLSSEPLFLCSLPGARPAAQLLRRST